MTKDVYMCITSDAYYVQEVIIFEIVYSLEND